MSDASLLRTFARYERALTKDMDLTPLQSIDRLQRMHKRFQKLWIGDPWLVCSDCYCISAGMPLPQMLEAIAAHGQPCGLVGLALLPKRGHFRVLKAFFRTGPECQAAVNKSADAATDKFLDATQKIRDLHLGRGDS